MSITACKTLENFMRKEVALIVRGAVYTAFPYRQKKFSLFMAPFATYGRVRPVHKKWLSTR